jgi:hypothetical protein
MRTPRATFGQTSQLTATARGSTMAALLMHPDRGVRLAD